MKFEILGRYILVEYYNCDENVFKDLCFIENFMNDLVLNVKVIIVDFVFYYFNFWGVLGVVIIVEFYLIIYIWFEYGYVVVDFFICGDIDLWKSFELLE